MTLFLMVCVLAAQAALPGTCRAVDTIRINGSGSCLDMMEPLIEAYRKINRSVRIEMNAPMGSSGAIKALLAGALDVVASGRPLKPEEAAKGGRQNIYGKIPMAIVTDKGHHIANITTRELEEIYAGRTSRWPNGDTVRLVLRPNEDIDTRILRSLSPGMDGAMTAAMSRPGMIVALTDRDAYLTIAKIPGALGTTGLTSIIVERLPLTILALNGVKPSPRSLASGAYPLFKEINFVTPPRTSAAAQKFLGFIHSPQGRAIAEKAGVLVTTGPATYE